MSRAFHKDSSPRISQLMLWPCGALSERGRKTALLLKAGLRAKFHLHPQPVCFSGNTVYVVQRITQVNHQPAIKGWEQVLLAWAASLAQLLAEAEGRGSVGRRGGGEPSIKACFGVGKVSLGAGITLQRAKELGLPRKSLLMCFEWLKANFWSTLLFAFTPALEAAVCA